MSSNFYYCNGIFLGKFQCKLKFLPLNFHMFSGGFNLGSSFYRSNVISEREVFSISSCFIRLPCHTCKTYICLCVLFFCLLFVNICCLERRREHKGKRGC